MSFNACCWWFWEENHIVSIVKQNPDCALDLNIQFWFLILVVGMVLILSLDSLHISKVHEIKCTRKLYVHVQTLLSNPTKNFPNQNKSD